MKIKIGHPLIQWGRSKVAYSFEIGLVCCDMERGAWSFGLQFGSWWISLSFQFIITKDRLCREKRGSAGISLST